MIPLLYVKALRWHRFAWLAGITALAGAQTIQTAQNAQNTPSITKYTDINVGSVVARPLSGMLVRLNSSLGTRAPKDGISLGRFSLSGKKGDGWSIANGSAVPFTLTGPKGGTLRVTALTFDPSTPSGIFPASGTTGEFSVGVTMAAGTGATPAGPYTGSFNLSVTDTTTGRISTTIFIVRADVDPAISLTQGSNLYFGDIVSGTSGTVTIAPGGGQSHSGVTVAGGMTGAASFNVFGAAGHSYSISLPSNTDVSVYDAGNVHSMSVTNFTSNPVGTGTIGTDDTITVGATLNVGTNQFPNAYIGTFSVTVAYN